MRDTRRGHVAGRVTPVEAYVALGSNLGDRLNHIRLAVERLAAHPNVRVVSLSRVVETPPMGPQDQGPYLNAVVSIETTLTPVAVLGLCQQIERAGRRQRDVHWGPRTIDLDLVDVGGLVATTPRLRLPHPGVAERIFMLAPLADVAPQWRHPRTGELVSELMAKLSVQERESLRVVAEACRWWPHAAQAGSDR